MFFHMDLKAKKTHTHRNVEFEIVVYRAQEDGHYNAYVSTGGFGDLIVELAGTTASDLQPTTGADPVEQLVKVLQCEIDAGKFDAWLTRSHSPNL